jgi:3-deoxy-D-manno-octulosonic-acid transferase
MEPARLGRAIVIGPLVSNFSEQVGTLRDAKAACQVNSAAELSQFVNLMLRDSKAAAAMGARAAQASNCYRSLPYQAAETIATLALSRMFWRVHPHRGS